MGLDVFGKNPTSETGTYFRNNFWWWRPLADFITSTYPDLTAVCHYWHSNDGDGLDEAASLALAYALQRDIDNGTVARHAVEHTERLAALPKEICTLCDGSGVRTDDVGHLDGYDTPRDPLTGKDGCNGCAGEGKVSSFETNYPFEVENVSSFVAFLRESGGFVIC